MLHSFFLFLVVKCVVTPLQNKIAVKKHIEAKHKVNNEHCTGAWPEYEFDLKTLCCLFLFLVSFLVKMSNMKKHIEAKHKVNTVQELDQNKNLIWKLFAVYLFSSCKITTRQNKLLFASVLSPKPFDRANSIIQKKLLPSVKDIFMNRIQQEQFREGLQR